MDNFKKCSKCGEVKLLECFSLNKRSRDGYQYACKKCAIEYVNKYYAKNREEVKARMAKYRAENYEKVKAKESKYRAENPENPEKRKARIDKWRAENPEKVKSNLAKYQKRLPDAYIKSRIKKQTGVPNERITKDLIETKRLHILIQRKLKDLTK